jgi:mannose-6-phosphate isomerase-like protein (cupin superfamily)
MNRKIEMLAVIMLVFMFSNVVHAEIMNALVNTPYQEGIDPDPEMFFENREKMHTVVDGAVNWTQLLNPLAGNDPLFPKEKGAVLVELKGVAHAFINPGAKSDPVTLRDEQRIYYFYRGNGKVSCNGKTADVRDGIGLLIPPGLEYTLENNGADVLAMYIIQEPIPEGFTPNKEMLVKDEYKLTFLSGGGHWWHLGTERLFSKEEGLAVLTGCRPVKFDAMTMSQPHSHNKNSEECWFSVRGTSNKALLGKKFFDFPPGTIYKVPADAVSAHANINTSEDSSMKVFWMMISKSGDRPDYGRLDPAALDMNIHPDIDMFISNWREEAPVITHGGLVERDVLTQAAGDPLKPHRRGAVLKYTKQFSYATLYGRTITTETTPEHEQELFYIVSGNGELEADGKKYALHKDVAVLVPEGMTFKIANLSAEDLTMYHIVEPAPTGFDSADEIIWRDESLQSVHTRTAHWVNTNRRLIDKENFSDLYFFLTVTIPPNTFAQPHSHGENIEEVWLALTDNAYVLLGKELRKLNKGTAYMIPPDDATPHANFNITGEPVKFLYFARGWDK